MKELHFNKLIPVHTTHPMHTVHAGLEQVTSVGQNLNPGPTR